MKNRLFIAATLLPLLVSCASSTRKESDREAVSSTLEESGVALAAWLENAPEEHSFRLRQTDDEGEVYIL